MRDRISVRQALLAVRLLGPMVELLLLGLFILLVGVSEAIEVVGVRLRVCCTWVIRA